jgi:hypothetical protein
MKKWLILLSFLAVTGCGTLAPAKPSALSSICVVDTFWEQRRLSVPEIPDDFGPLAQVDEQPEPPAPKKEFFPRLILFTDPPHCVPCRSQDEVLRRLAEWDRQGYWSVGPESHNIIQVLDADHPLAEFYGVTQIPCWVRVRWNGEFVKVSGVLSKEQIVGFQRGSR